MRKKHCNICNKHILTFYETKGYVNLENYHLYAEYPITFRLCDKCFYNFKTIKK